MHADHVELKIAQEKLCIDQCAENKTAPWNMEDLETVLSDLKKETSRDPYGYANELFKN